jgi:hypothetical protein
LYPYPAIKKHGIDNKHGKHVDINNNLPNSFGVFSLKLYYLIAKPITVVVKDAIND